MKLFTGANDVLLTKTSDGRTIRARKLRPGFIADYLRRHGYPGARKHHCVSCSPRHIAMQFAYDHREIDRIAKLVEEASNFYYERTGY